MAEGVIDDKPASNSVGTLLYRYAYFMTQRQDDAKSMVWRVQEWAKLMSSHALGQLPIIWHVKMLREYDLHYRLDEGETQSSCFMVSSQ